LYKVKNRAKKINSSLKVGGGMSVGQGGGCASSITRLVSQTGTLSEEIDIKVWRVVLHKITFQNLQELYIKKNAENSWTSCHF
jgi:hypothetical protein